MQITRRQFLKYCGMTAAALGLTSADLLRLEKALANPAAPPIIWLAGASCTGDSESLLNRISAVAPLTAADALVNAVNLVYHPQLTSVAGEDVVRILDSTYEAGNYWLAVEGGVPTALNGATCWAYSAGGVDVTFLEAVRRLASRAAAVLAVGTCAAYGGIPASGTNLTGIRSVAEATGRATVNIAGCPTHPDWIVWALVQLLLNRPIALDSLGRPKALFERTIHDRCPRKGTSESSGDYGIDGRCLKDRGCRGPKTKAECPVGKWNNGVEWCVGANVPCLGCTEPTFPGPDAFYRPRKV